MLSGLIFFAAAILIVALAGYFGLLLVYQPYLNNQLSVTQNKVATADQSIASGDQTKLIAFYSQIVNVQALLKKHVLFSRFLSWLEKNTEANVSYSQFSFSSGNQITLAALAKSEADTNQQIAIFESSPYVTKVAISSIAPMTTGGLWAFSGTLIMNPAFFTAATATSTP